MKLNKKIVFLVGAGAIIFSIIAALIVIGWMAWHSLVMQVNALDRDGNAENAVSIARMDHQTALAMLDRAIDRFGSHDSEVAAKKYLGGVQTDDLHDRLVYLYRSASADDHYFYDNSCGSNILAYAAHPSSSNNAEASITICQNYLDRPRKERIETIIHEWTHIYLGTDDLRYRDDSTLFYSMPAGIAGKNADSIANFIMMLGGK